MNINYTTFDLLALPLWIFLIWDALHSIKTGEDCRLYIPPPLLSAELLENIQLVNIGDDPSLYIPPPLSRGEPLPWAYPPDIVNPSKTAVLSIFVPLTT